MPKGCKMLAVTAILAAAALATPAAAQMRAEIHGGVDRAGGDGINKWGGFGGVGLGYDVVAAETHGFGGVEVNADYSTIRECRTSVILAGDRACGRAGLDLSAGVRFGYRGDGGTSVYGLIAFTRTHLTTRYTAGGTTVRDGDDLDGVRLGGGVQFDIGANSYAKIEYRYSDYEQHFRRHQGLVGVGIRF